MYTCLLLLYKYLHVHITTCSYKYLHVWLTSPEAATNSSYKLLVNSLDQFECNVSQFLHFIAWNTLLKIVKVSATEKVIDSGMEMTRGFTWHQFSDDGLTCHCASLDLQNSNTHVSYYSMCSTCTTRHKTRDTSFVPFTEVLYTKHMPSSVVIPSSASFLAAAGLVEGDHYTFD